MIRLGKDKISKFIFRMVRVVDNGKLVDSVIMKVM